MVLTMDSQSRVPGKTTWATQSQITWSGRRWGRRTAYHQGTPDGIKPVREKGGRGRQIGRTKGGMNTKLHAVADAKGRPIGFFMSAGQVSDYTGAAALLGIRPVSPL
jgi:hypothetical protein